ncbi:MAG: hypothetical protein WHS64_08710 [Fervidobacterium sp.]|uniref:hypothetical protein n=1 Tax=Fervidobacterium TaxID=2422 RepID=UPI0022082BBF|nr:hypothetical protein IB67_07005 [Fervidobacterium riparium]
MRHLFISLLFLIILLVFQITAFSWSSHGVFTFLVVTSIDGFDYSKLVEISEYSYSESRNYKAGRYITHDLVQKGEKKIDREDDVLQETDIEIVPDLVLSDGKIPVWMIFLVYSSLPDNGMDFVEDNFLASLFLGETQANRHGYFKVSFFEYFEGDKSFLHFLRMSKNAFNKGDMYWGYRFLAYALHYLEDLMQPYHVRPGTVPEMLTYLFDGRMKTFLRNAHFAYDDYMTFLLYFSKHKYAFRELVKSTKPLILPVSDDQLIYEAIVYSYTSFFAIHEEIKKAFGTILSERRVRIEDFQKAEEEGKLDNLYKLTKKLVSALTSLAKGIIITTVPIPK